MTAAAELQTIIAGKPMPESLINGDPPAFDPLRVEIEAAIRERAERADAAAAARKAAERLTAFCEKVEKKQSNVNVFGETGPDEEVLRLVETARLRNPELLPTSPERLARVAAAEGLVVAKEALALALSRCAQADAALAEVNERVET